MAKGMVQIFKIFLGFMKSCSEPFSLKKFFSLNKNGSSFFFKVGYYIKVLWPKKDKI